VRKPRLTRQRVQTIERALEVLEAVQAPRRPGLPDEPAIARPRVLSALSWAKKMREIRAELEELPLFRRRRE